MAEGSWHGLRGPADFLIPDDTRELIYSGAFSAISSAGAYVINHRAVTKEIGKMAAHHVANVYAANPRAIYPRAALRSIASRQVVRGGTMRALGILLPMVPGVGLIATAVTFAYSIPPSVRDASGMSGYERYQAEMASKWYMSPM